MRYSERISMKIILLLWKFIWDINSQIYIHVFLDIDLHIVWLEHINMTPHYQTRMKTYLVYFFSLHFKYLYSLQHTVSETVLITLCQINLLKIHSQTTRISIVYYRWVGEDKVQYTVLTSPESIAVSFNHAHRKPFSIALVIFAMYKEKIQ